MYSRVLTFLLWTCQRPPGFLTFLLCACFPHLCTVHLPQSSRVLTFLLWTCQSHLEFLTFLIVDLSNSFLMWTCQSVQGFFPFYYGPPKVLQGSHPPVVYLPKSFRVSHLPFASQSESLSIPRLCSAKVFQGCQSPIAKLQKSSRVSYLSVVDISLSSGFPHLSIVDLPKS